LKASHETPSDGVAEQPSWAADIKGVISPHIDFTRGGPVYGQVWATAAPAVKEADLVVILGTDHNGGEGEITLTRQSYETPWGIVPTDREVVTKIASLAGEDAVFGGELRHRGEHSVEAALIWAHYLMRERPCFVVPILCGSFESFIRQNVNPSTNSAISATIEVLRDVAAKRRTVIVAAADLAHVGPAFGGLLPLDLAARARLEAQDRRLIEILGKADPAAFLEEIRSDGDQRHICGIPPIYITLAVLSGLAGSPAGYAQCPASEEGTSIVSICGMVYH
jgi:AmmeMemoRadiSam system protein B